MLTCWLLCVQVVKVGKPASTTPYVRRSSWLEGFDFGCKSSKSPAHITQHGEQLLAQAIFQALPACFLKCSMKACAAGAASTPDLVKATIWRDTVGETKASVAMDDEGDKACAREMA